MHQKSYISAITGLRAIAVLSIFLFHINEKILPGGFVGVDIFFVISGFVVAHSVCGAQNDTFREYFLWFYKRRFQRILPALWVFIATATVLSVLFIPAAAETKYFDIAAAASVFGLSNIVLYIKAGNYFAAASELNPFTHTWSLAVEEQYYVIFPLFSYFIFASRNTANRWRPVALAIVVSATIISLVAAAALTSQNPTFAFYMLPSRLWELGSGFLLRVALDDARTAKITAATRSLRGLIAVLALAILTASFFLTGSTGFPFPGAIPPCLATLILIGHVWCHPQHWLDRSLSMRLPIWFGNISYSLYLWHWGVIVLMRWTIGLETLPQQAMAAVTSLLLAWVSYRYVEKAFYRQNLPEKSGHAMFLRYGLVAVGMLGLCAAGAASKPFVGLSKANDRAIWDPYARPPLPADCPTPKVVSNLGAGFSISFPAGCARENAPQLFIVGDSHAGAYHRLAWRLASTGQWKVELLSLGGCRFVYLTDVPDVAGCKAFLELAMERLKKNVKPEDIIFLAGLQTPRFNVDSGLGSGTSILDPVRIDASRRRIAELEKLGARVLIEGPKPVISVAAYRCADWFNKNNPACRLHPGDTPQERWQRMAVARNGIAKVVEGFDRVYVWEPAEVLCSNQSCPSEIEARPVFFDTDHLSASSNDLLLKSFEAALRKW